MFDYPELAVRVGNRHLDAAWNGFVTVPEHAC